MITNNLVTLSNFLDLHSSKYEKMLIIGGFNFGIDEQQMKSFVKHNPTKQPTCYKRREPYMHLFDPY